MEIKRNRLDPLSYEITKRDGAEKKSGGMACSGLLHPYVEKLYGSLLCYHAAAGVAYGLHARRPGAWLLEEGSRKMKDIRAVQEFLETVGENLGRCLECRAGEGPAHKTLRGAFGYVLEHERSITDLLGELQDRAEEKGHRRLYNFIGRLFRVQEEREHVLSHYVGDLELIGEGDVYAFVESFPG